jgi:hypothetical protein
MFSNYKNNKTNENKLGMEIFLNVLQYIKNKSSINKSYKLVKTTTLDVSYSQKQNKDIRGDKDNNDSDNDDTKNNDIIFNTFRMTIDENDNINNSLRNINSRSNHVIFKVLLSKFLEDDPNVTLIKKTRYKKDIYDIDDFNIRTRLAQEVSVTESEIEELKELTETSRNDIIFRYKQRVSMIILDTKTQSLRVDLTYVKSSPNVNTLEESNQGYELELEYFLKKKESGNKNVLNDIYVVVDEVLKVMQQSNYILTKKEKERIVSQYYQLIGVDRAVYKNLYGRKSQSLEIQHVVDILPNKYAVTDKADGDRNFLFIFENKIYFLSSNLDVVDSGIILPSSLSSYNYTILDGELIYLSKHNRHLFLAFDCLFKQNVDIRTESSFIERLNHVNDVISKCFVSKKDKYFKLSDYTKKFNTEAFMKHHSDQIDKFLDALNHDIKLTKKNPLIRSKYFISVNGGQNNEIFKYSKLLWNKYVFDSNTKCPYILDGLVYHPLDQSYIVSVKETSLFEYKWKPPEKNTMDFYITFERNKETNNILSIYDNSLDENLKWKPYSICYLHVGLKLKDKEIPVLFKRNEGRHIAYLFTDDGEVKDISGNSIQGRTVVEFYYNHDPDTPPEFRWVPVRTRFEKTESVTLHHKKYGNYATIADRIWRSITNPFVMKDIEILSDDKSYDRHTTYLRGKIDHSLIVSERKENAYYQVKTTLGKSMRNFHNWVKSNLIYTYYNQVYEYGTKLSVLDYGVGRGGDLMKFYYGKIDYLVGFDNDISNLLSATDGAVSRYKRLKKTHDSFPRMYFIHADGAALLHPDEQKKALGYTSPQNKELIDKFFGSSRKKFDRINCQFAMHYFLGNDTVWGNFCNNINTYLKPGGYILLTTYDAQKVVDALGENEKFGSYYVTQKGEKKLFFEIVKRYEKLPSPIGLGHAIDVHNSMISHEGVYITEYLVDKNFIQEEFRVKCGLELVDSDLFSNQFEIHKDFFTDIVQFESNDKTRDGIFKNASSYYNKNDSVNLAGYEQTKLNRYYVFRKTEEPVKQKGGGKKKEESEHISYSLLDIINLKSKYVIRNTTTTTPRQTFCGGLYDVFQFNNIIPKTISMKSFYSDINANIYDDDELTDRKIKSINKRLKIDHFTDTSADMALDGLNIIILETDCDGSISTTIHNKNTKSICDNSLILLYKNGSYKPVYRLENDKLNGILKTNDIDVQNILNINEN